MTKMIKYDKLVRDRIPEIIEADGKKALTRVLGIEETKNYLGLKLKEELEEYLTSNQVEELADLQEVIFALLECHGITRSEFEKIRLKKVKQRGAFSRKLLLEAVIE